jgi:hypothetical protein
MNHGGATLNASRHYTYIELVAANIVALDIAHETIVLPVLCLADSSPSSTILDRWQGIWLIDNVWLVRRLRPVKLDKMHICTDSVRSPWTPPQGWQ